MKHIFKDSLNKNQCRNNILNIDFIKTIVIVIGFFVIYTRRGGGCGGARRQGGGLGILLKFYQATNNTKATPSSAKSLQNLIHYKTTSPSLSSKNMQLLTSNSSDAKSLSISSSRLFLSSSSSNDDHDDLPRLPMFAPFTARRNQVRFSGLGNSSPRHRRRKEQQQRRKGTTKVHSMMFFSYGYNYMCCFLNFLLLSFDTLLFDYIMHIRNYSVI